MQESSDARQLLSIGRPKMDRGLTEVTTLTTGEPQADQRLTTDDHR